jgi:hypothetical protein
MSVKPPVERQDHRSVEDRIRELEAIEDELEEVALRAEGTPYGQFCRRLLRTLEEARDD